MRADAQRDTRLRGDPTERRQSLVSAGARLQQDEGLGGLPTAEGTDLRPTNPPRTAARTDALLGGVPTAAAEAPRPAGNCFAGGWPLTGGGKPHRGMLAAVAVQPRAASLVVGGRPAAVAMQLQGAATLSVSSRPQVCNCPAEKPLVREIPSGSGSLGADIEPPSEGYPLGDIPAVIARRPTWASALRQSAGSRRQEADRLAA